jgi:hypothetical protein
MPVRAGLGAVRRRCKDTSRGAPRLFKFERWGFRVYVRTQRLKPSSSRALKQRIKAVFLSETQISRFFLKYAVAHFEADTSQGKVLDTRRLLNYKAK